MPLTRISYWHLPLGVRHTIEETTGTVIAATSFGTGLNSSVAALLQTPGRRYFVKALPIDHRWAWTQAREAEIAPHLHPVAPAVHARIVDQGWDVLVSDALEGHPADYTPASADLPHVAGLLTQIGRLPRPAIALRQAEQRLQAYAEASDLHYFAGDALLHTDLNPANIIINGHRAHIVDWGWATRGAPWLDAAYWTIWLIAAGHPPAAAEHHAAAVSSWKTAPVRGIDAFAAASERLWAEIAGPQPDAFASPLAAAARLWHQHRSLRRDGLRS